MPSTKVSSRQPTFFSSAQSAAHPPSLEASSASDDETRGVGAEEARFTRLALGAAAGPTELSLAVRRREDSRRTCDAFTPSSLSPSSYLIRYVPASASTAETVPV
eukprot:COSAG01_NODE_9493_length_2432_cov_1.423060_2_plen_105_part_00